MYCITFLYILNFRRKSYKSQEFFWSDLGFAMVIEAVGKIDSSLETVRIYSMDAKDSDKFD